MKKFSIIVLSFLTLLSSSVIAYDVDCEGYDSDTGEYVYGECSDGDFEGYGNNYGEYVYGDCEAGGDLEGYKNDTGAYVYGECDDY